MKSINLIVVFLLIAIVTICFILKKGEKFERTVLGNPPDDESKILFSGSDALLYENNFGDSSDSKYLEYIRQKYIYAPSKVGVNLTFPDQPNSDYSQHGQSLFVANLLKNKSHGFFIECGAAGGEKLSNSLYFELKYSWTGLLVEANSKWFTKLLGTKRNSYMSNVCLSPENVSSKLNFETRKLWSGGLVDHDLRQGVNSIEIQCFPLDHLLSSIGVKYVDYLSLDIEGPELEVLQNVPFHLIHIEVIGVEYKVLKVQEDGVVKTDVVKTREKLQSFRTLFKMTGLYKEVGILPIRLKSSTAEYDKQYAEDYGLDIFFQRI